MKTKKIIANILIVLVAIAGLGLILYPHFSFWLAKQDQTYIVQEYDNTMANIDKAEREAEIKKAQEYNQQLLEGSLVDPYTVGKSEVDQTYLSLLNVQQDSIMGHIKIPKINVDLPIFHTAEESVLQKGVGHLEGSALPVGGASTHSVLTGHTGLNAAKMFTDLEQLQKGDEFYFYVMGEIFAYQVIDITVVEPQDVSSLNAVPDKDLATLITCTPYGINSHRLLVTGERVPYTEEEVARRIEQTVSTVGRETMLMAVGLIALAALVVLAVVFFLILRVRNKKRAAQGSKNKKIVYQRRNE